jgi:hypothetical protein
LCGANRGVIVCRDMARHRSYCQLRSNGLRCWPGIPEKAGSMMRTGAVTQVAPAQDNANLADASGTIIARGQEQLGSGDRIDLKSGL